MKETIQCKYSCFKCNIVNRVVTVVARESEDVVYWMENICIVTIAKDHSTQSPHCLAKSLSNLMIPIDGADKIGGVLRSPNE